MKEGESMSGMTQREYREAEGISRSELNILRELTPFHFKYSQEHRDETESLALLEGRAAHKEILEPDEFADEFACAPQCDRRTKEGKEIYARFLTESEGKEVLYPDSYQKVKDMAEAIRQNKQAMRFLQGQGALHELSYFWTDPETEELCKVRPDCITTVDGKKYIVDYKTTESCADGAFERSVKKYGYKFQAGMYREGVFQNTYEDYGFVFIAQEKKAPYAVRVYICNEDFINEGYEQFRQTINLYHYCKVNDVWYGYEGPENIISELVGEGDI